MVCLQFQGDNFKNYLLERSFSFTAFPLPTWNNIFSTCNYILVCSTFLDFIVLMNEKCVARNFSSVVKKSGQNISHYKGKKSLCVALDPNPSRCAYIYIYTHLPRFMYGPQHQSIWAPHRHSWMYPQQDAFKVANWETEMKGKIF